jgi:formate-dependent nitrite reductase membrane component NrfD
MFEYSWYHIAPWGAELSIYFFLIGMAGMSYALATAPDLFGGKFEGLRPVQMPALVVDLIIVAICVPLLIDDLGQPMRFLYPVWYFHWTSPLSWGSVFLVLFTACIVGFYWFKHHGNRGELLKPIAIIGSLLGLSMPLYTGLDLMVNTTREVWATPYIPVIFTVLSISSGTAMIALIAWVRGATNPDVLAILHTILLASVATTFALFLGFVMTLLYGSGELQQGLSILNEQYGMQIWFLAFVIGILLPLGMLAMPAVGRQPAMLIGAGFASMVGAFMVREVILVAGQLPQLFY